MAVLLHRGAAAGRVADDGVEPLRFEDVDQPAREAARLLHPARVQAQGSAAALRLRNDDRAAFRAQDARGRRIHAREEDALHAARQQAHAPALGTAPHRMVGPRCVDGGFREVARPIERRFAGEQRRGVDIDLLSSRYGVDVWRRFGARLRPFLEAGILLRQDSHLRLTRPGMLLANEVMSVFV